MRLLAALLAVALFVRFADTDAPRVADGDARVQLDSLFDDVHGGADPYRGLAQPAWRRVQVDRAWDVARGSPQIVVATIDTGVDPGHPDLDGVLLPGATFDSAPSRGCDASDEDDNGHGTHVAGIIAATGRDAAAVSGVAFGVRILPIKALDCAGSGRVADIADAIVWATDHGARVINVSLGTRLDLPVLAGAVAYAQGHDVLVVAAAGNCGAAAARCGTPNAVEYPAAYAGVLAVGATDADDAVTGFSTRGRQIALVAPGTGITSTTPRYSTYLSMRGASPLYGVFSGTSQASAVVAGIAALVWSAEPSLTSRQLFARLVVTADDLGAPGRDDAYGFGRVNALRAVQDIDVIGRLAFALR